MGNVVNLRQARKRAAKGRSEADADANRVAFGLSRSLKDELRRQKARSLATIDSHRLEHPQGSGSSRSSPAAEADPAGGSGDRAAHHGLKASGAPGDPAGEKP